MTFTTSPDPALTDADSTDFGPSSGAKIAATARPRPVDIGQPRSVRGHRHARAGDRRDRRQARIGGWVMVVFGLLMVLLGLFLPLFFPWLRYRS